MLKKDKSIRGMAVTAAILSGCNMIFNCLIVIFPGIFSPLLLGTELSVTSFGNILPLQLLQAVLPVMLLIIALFNIKSDTFQESRGTGTVIAVGVCWIVGIFVNAWLTRIVMQLCVVQGSEMVALYNASNIAQNFCGFLGTIARFLLISIASIEIYVTGRNLTENN